MMSAKMDMPLDGYYKMEMGSRRLYASELIQLYRNLGITPNDILLPQIARNHFSALSEQLPTRIIIRVIVLRYLRLPAEFRQVIDALIESLYKASIFRKEITERDSK